MSARQLTLEARRENALALAAALGVSSADAARALAVEIGITADPGDREAVALGRDIADLLGRTVERLSTGPSVGPVAAEVIVGMATPRTAAPAIYVDIRADTAVIGRLRTADQAAAPLPPILRLLAACYTSAATLHHALGGALPIGVPDPLVVRFDALGVDTGALVRPVDLGLSVMAGAGAIGNGLLFAGYRLDLGGTLIIADDDLVSAGNLNRQVWFERDDIDKPKATRLVARAQPFLPRLKLMPRQCRLQDLLERSDGPWLKRLIVAVDSRRARRALQTEFPCEVFDASTTDIREVVIHHHAQPARDACLSCIYEADAEELSREQHIADHLGVPVAAVRRQRISTLDATTIVDRFPQLVTAQLIGTAYDTLFKRLCAEGELRTVAGRNIVAPFAFVSVLAGTLLALELVRRLGSGDSARDFNYWRVSPWHAPLARRRIIRPRQPGCTFCGDPVLQRVNAALWH
jgi:hypothetical protein